MCLEWKDGDENRELLGKGETSRSSQLCRTAVKFHPQPQNLKYIYRPSRMCNLVIKRFNFSATCSLGHYYTVELIKKYLISLTLKYLVQNTNGNLSISPAHYETV